jgi:DNA (cytosine-5)-methyltransferase 3A
MKGKRIVSCFDGGSGGNVAALSLGWKIEKYWASEIDKFAMKHTQANFPWTIQVGNVVRLRAYLQAGLSKLRKIKPEHPRYQLAQECIDMLTNGVDLLIGGSPCQGFSFAGKQLNFKDPRSALFFEFVKIKDLLKPKYFFLENVKMKKEYEAVITRHMGVLPIEINAALVSAQNRNRLYWTNIAAIAVNLFGDLAPNIPQPKDRGKVLRDVLQAENEIPEKFYLSSEKILRGIEKSKAQIWKKSGKRMGKMAFPNNIDKKAKCITTVQTEGGRETNHVAYLKLDINGNLKSKQDKASCITGGGHSGGNHSDMDVLCISQVGRKIDERGKRADNRKDLKAVQRFEPRLDEKTNCLTTVDKDNLILQLGRGKNQGGLHKYKAPTLTANSYEQNNLVLQHFLVRRLTPREMMRLQGWPDSIKQVVSDTQTTKICGNGWQNDVIKYIWSFTQWE